MLGGLTLGGGDEVGGLDGGGAGFGSGAGLLIFEGGSFPLSGLVPCPSFDGSPFFFFFHVFSSVPRYLKQHDVFALKGKERDA